MYHAALLDRQLGEEALAPGLDVGDQRVGLAGVEHAVDREVPAVAVEAEIDRVHGAARGLGRVLQQAGGRRSNHGRARSSWPAMRKSIASSP
jgi:hypothetical protein